MQYNGLLSDEEAKEYGQDILTYANDLGNQDKNLTNNAIMEIMTLLDANKENLNKIKNQNFFKRSWNTITGGNKKLKEINSDNLLTVQKLSLSLISELEKQNQLTREAQILIYEKLNDVKEENIKFKIFINNILNKIADRFENLERDNSFNLLIHEISQGVYEGNKVEIILEIVSKITNLDLINERKINLLKKAMINNEILNEENRSLKTILEDISSIPTIAAERYLYEVALYGEHPVIKAMEESLKYAALEEKKKKFLRFPSVLQKINEEIEIEAELNTIELLDFIVEDKVNAISSVQGKNDLESKEISNMLPLPEDSDVQASQENVDGCDCAIKVAIAKEQGEIQKEEIFKNSINVLEEDVLSVADKKVRILRPIHIKGILEFNNCDIIIESELEVYGTLKFNNSRICFKNEEQLWYIYANGGTIDFKGCKVRAEHSPANGEIIFLATSRITIDDCDFNSIGNLIKYDIEASSYGFESNKTFISLRKKVDAARENTNNILGEVYKLWGEKDWSHYIKLQNSRFTNTSGHIIYYDDANSGKIEIINCEFKNHREMKNIDYGDTIISTYGRYMFSVNCEEVLIEKVKVTESCLPVIYSRFAELTIRESEFSDMQHKFYLMNLSNDEMLIDRATFNSCPSIYYSPGCLKEDDYKGRFKKCTFNKSFAADKAIENSYEEAHRGGAVEMATASAEFKECSFTDCKARIGGAIYLRHFGRFKIDNCTFKNCKAEKPGGAIRIFSDDPHRIALIENCEFINCRTNSNEEHSEIDIENSYETGVFKKKNNWFDCALMRNNDFR